MDEENLIKDQEKCVFIVSRKFMGDSEKNLIDLYLDCI